MSVDAGVRKPLMNASNSAEVRCRACRAAWIDSRSRSSSASAAFSSNRWRCSSGVTVLHYRRPMLRQAVYPRSNGTSLGDTPISFLVVVVYAGHDRRPGLPATGYFVDLVKLNLANYFAYARRSQ